jgi:hypothetical protein
VFRVVDERCIAHVLVSRVNKASGWPQTPVRIFRKEALLPASVRMMEAQEAGDWETYRRLKAKAWRFVRSSLF